MPLNLYLYQNLLRPLEYAEMDSNFSQIKSLIDSFYNNGLIISPDFRALSDGYFTYDYLNAGGKSFSIRSGDGDIKFRVSGAGNVLIGTTTDAGTGKLQVDGNISATGFTRSGNTIITGQETTVQVNTITPIYTPPLGVQGFALVLVSGDNGYEGFSDLLIVGFNQSPKVVSSNNQYGTPGARTYSNSSLTLRVNISTGAVQYNIRVQVLGGVC